MDAPGLLLTTAFRHVISEPTIEAGYERVAALIGAAAQPGRHVADGQTAGMLTEPAFREAVAALLRDGLVHEPVRLPEGALQCHWHLELTPKGVAAARALLATSPEP